MTKDGTLERTHPDKPIALAILAMGGQGGGVLSDWIVALAESQNWAAQSTSVPGVAQRTGATIYYVEMLPPLGDRMPVLSLMPTPGDVDVVLAAEYMEAGRSMLRGLVTPDRTTLIASTHRSLAVSEKEQAGDGIADSGVVGEATPAAAKHSIVFDMQTMAEKNGSVISAVMFGALAGAKVLPFGRDAFEAAIRAGGKGIEPSLRAFGAGFDRATNPVVEPVEKKNLKEFQQPPQSLKDPRLDKLLQQIRQNFPAALAPLLYTGIVRLVDYQDPKYGQEYLDRLGAIHLLDVSLAGEKRDFALTREAAKYVAIAMAYDDVVRVADLKTRSTRFARVDAEVGKKQDQLLYMTEFMHPRMDEVAGTMPAGLGRWIENHPSVFNRLDKLVNRGRRVQTRTIFWFLSLYMVAGLRPFRRRLLRHQKELAHLNSWLALATDTAPKDYDLAVEVLKCRRLVKGYSDTMARGNSRFERVLQSVPQLIGKPDSAGWLRRLTTAALADEDGAKLTGAQKTLETAFEVERPRVA
ncbi:MULTISPECIES: indolepyruvate oxidoreductase subunit beta family protein [unclassified Beijerinckia]|uniref:indolepyruvate oxidoreductase subunit beta family protein n=1 Tax=unclassified Beijerinckia TaxID=2638183 RepID=UPI00089557EA|nr:MULTISPECIES: indolepyruvate oxidoreductase subunit beta family protein [unclassified Beijerinckia]MDH7797579.1 indolepyruvate ferredoxin oxidoreductase beta subunit [Beijerinckia sp. GAS462]SEC91180.1 indolepyruvate ferredoxin oxidoreductase beta subunit [Beijerinckia sp. 28-YEA-48]